MMKKFFLPILLILTFTIFNSFFIIKEGQQGIVLRFGEPVGNAYDSAGLKMKVPFIDKVTIFEKKILEWDGSSSEMPIKDDTKGDEEGSDGFAYVLIDAYARWKIEDPLKFYKSVRNESMAQSRLDDIIDGALRDQIANTYVSEIIKSSDNMDQRNCNREKGVWRSGSCSVDIGDHRKGISAEISSAILNNAKNKIAELDMGIDLIDVKFKRIQYNKGVQRRLFDNMISRQKVKAEIFRAEGQSEKEDILGRQKYEQKSIISAAELKAKEIIGEADAEAVKIYANSYSKSPEFYNFKRSLDSYKNSIDPTTKIILSTENKYLEYLNKK